MTRPGPTGLLSISAEPGCEYLYSSFFPKPGEPATLLTSDVSLYGLASCARLLRSIQKMIPARARASGIPTAHPTIIPILELDWAAGGDGVSLLTFPVGDADGVVTTVNRRVTTPAVPEETLVCSEVTGLGVADDTAGLDEAALAVAEEGAADDDGLGVFEA